MSRRRSNTSDRAFAASATSRGWPVPSVPGPEKPYGTAVTRLRGISISYAERAGTGRDSGNTQALREEGRRTQPRSNTADRQAHDRLRSVRRAVRRHRRVHRRARSSGRADHPGARHAEKRLTAGREPGVRLAQDPMADGRPPTAAGRLPARVQLLILAGLAETLMATGTAGRVVGGPLPVPRRGVPSPTRRRRGRPARRGRGGAG